MSASQTLEPWLEFHRLILSAPPKRENNTTRSLSGQQAFSKRRLGDGSRILAREINEFDISFFKIRFHTKNVLTSESDAKCFVGITKPRISFHPSPLVYFKPRLNQNYQTLSHRDDLGTKLG